MAEAARRRPVAKAGDSHHLSSRSEEDLHLRISTRMEIGNLYGSVDIIPDDNIQPCMNFLKEGRMYRVFSPGRWECPSFRKAWQFMQSPGFRPDIRNVYRPMFPRLRPHNQDMTVASGRPRYIRHGASRPAPLHTQPNDGR